MMDAMKRLSSVFAILALTLLLAGVSWTQSGQPTVNVHRSPT
jgi:hypothetical protein